MKKLPLVFCFLVLGCSASKQVIDNTAVYNKHPQPYHVFSVGKWNTEYVVLTLIDAKQEFFTVKTNYTSLAKKGAVYIP